MKKVALCFSVLLMLGFSSLCLADMKIGVVDVNKVLLTIPQVKNVQADLKKQFDPRNQEVISLQTILRGDVEKYRKNNASMKKEALKLEQQKLLDDGKKLRETQIGLQRDFINARSQALTPILKQIESTINKIAEEQNFDLIVTKISVAYNKAQYEITDQVIAEVSKLAPAATQTSTQVVAPQPVTNPMAKK
jgi:outer membrane protein